MLKEETFKAPNENVQCPSLGKDFKAGFIRQKKMDTRKHASRSSGTLDKYIGDCVMAFWNMPVAVKGHQALAVQAALDCREELPAIRAKGWPLEFRIGINTGTCLVGNLGSELRLNYTAIGDAVNVAARLEGLCKSYHARILVSGETHQGLEPGTFLTRVIDRASMKGKTQATTIYHVHPHPQGCMRREGTSEAAPEAVRQAVGGGCQSGWGRLLSVTNAIEAGTCCQGDSVWP